MNNFSDNLKILLSQSAADFEFDVAVVGGGTAGVFAAISAAKCGAKTVILERSSMLGGTATNGGVNFPGLFHAHGKQIIAGPCWEAIRRCEKAGGAKIQEMLVDPVEHWRNQISVDINIFNAVCEEMCEEAGVTIMYYSPVFSGAETVRNGVKGILLGVSCNNGAKTVFAKRVIDCTGDANFCSIMGFNLVRSETLQPCTIRNRLGGYDIKDVDEETANSMADKAFADGTLCRDEFWGWKIYQNLECHTINTHIFIDKCADSLSKTELELRARKTLLKFIKFFRTIPGMENVRVEYMAPECGVRETFRIVGKTVMSVDNYVDGYVYPDAVCYAFYPVDLHIKGGIHNIDTKENAVPTVPYSALIPTYGSDSNKVCAPCVLVAGRCISADQFAMSGLRVEAPCMAEGQAAGCAAAISAALSVDVEDVPYDMLSEKLSAMGCILP